MIQIRRQSTERIHKMILDQAVFILKLSFLFSVSTWKKKVSVPHKGRESGTVALHDIRTSERVIEWYVDKSNCRYWITDYPYLFLESPGLLQV